MNDLAMLLRENPYPGRGIAIGRSEDGNSAIFVYFIMGRSESSRNRVFEVTDDGICTSAYDPEKNTDSPLLIYNPVRYVDGWTIVTNGDQTDNIRDFIRGGRTFHSALRIRKFEQDPPIYTPRVSGLVGKNGDYFISIIKTINGNPDGCAYSFFEYIDPIPGVGHFMSTYKCAGDPPPPFEGEPIVIKMEATGGLEAYANKIWDALNEDNRVSLYAREINIASGEYKHIIINKYKRKGETA